MPGMEKSKLKLQLGRLVLANLKQRKNKQFLLYLSGFCRWQAKLSQTLEASI